MPSWIENTIHTKNTVEVDEAVYEQAERLQSKLREYKDNAELFIQGNYIAYLFMIFDFFS